MRIPFYLKLLAFFVDCIEKKNVQEPEMARFVDIKIVDPLQTTEESPPKASKLSPDFNPEPLNTCVTGGSA